MRVGQANNRNVESCFGDCRLEIKQAAEGGHHVPGLVEAQVSSMEEVWDVLQAGSSSRTVGSTRANDHSSRSHWCVELNGIAFCYDMFGCDRMVLCV